MKNGKNPDPNVIHPVAAGVEFVMNDANHQMNAVSTFPFYTLEGWEMNTPDPSEMPFKGNTAKPLRKRFDDDLIGLLLKFKWWDKSIEEINSLIPILTCSELEKVRNEIEARL